MLGRILILAESGLTPMMVLHHYMSKHITPLHERTRPTRLYTGVNDIMRLERGDESVISEEALVLVMGKLSPDLSSHDFITPLTSCQPLCMDQAARLMLLVAMPSMDDVGIAPIQRGDQSWGIQIPRAGSASGQGNAAPSPAPSKWKGKVVWVIRSDDEVSSDDDVPLERQMRARGRGRSTIDGPPLAAPVLRPTSSAAAWATVPRGCSGSLAVGDTVATTRGAAAKEAAAKKKATEEAVTKKKASEEAAKKTESGAVIAGSDPSPSPSVGVKRVTASSGSTPLAN
jgi:hypothetical protein